MSRTMRVTIDVTLTDEADAAETSEALFDYLCDGGDGIVAYPGGIDSVDGYEVLA